MDSGAARDKDGVMGLDPNFAAVTMNDPHGHVPIYNQIHHIIGHLGPAPFESASVNVRCIVRRWRCRDYYRLVGAAAFDPSATQGYVSAALTHPLNPEPPIKRCTNSCELVQVGAAVLAAAAVIALLRKRPRPEPPPVR